MLAQLAFGFKQQGKITIFLEVESLHFEKRYANKGISVEHEERFIYIFDIREDLLDCRKGVGEILD